MMKITILLALTLIATEASAQYQIRTYYGPSGGVTGRAALSSNGSTTLYDPAGRVTARSSISGNTTTIYDAAGRRTGTISIMRGL